jgi:hypothetical protein
VRVRKLDNFVKCISFDFHASSIELGPNLGIPRNTQKKA